MVERANQMNFPFEINMPVNSWINNNDDDDDDDNNNNNSNNNNKNIYTHFICMNEINVLAKSIQIQ